MENKKKKRREEGRRKEKEKKKGMETMILVWNSMDFYGLV